MSDWIRVPAGTVVEQLPAKPAVTAYPIGARVLLDPGDVEAVVIGITVRERGVASYECVWWSGRTRNVAWVDASEVVKCVQPNKHPVTIGFLP